jgi:hypothetical protein
MDILEFCKETTCIYSPEYRIKYCTVIKNKEDKLVLIANRSERSFFTLDTTELLVDDKIHVILNKRHSISHNFTVFYDKDKTVFYGVGGLCRNQGIYKSRITKEDESINKGIYLLKSDDLYNWTNVVDGPVISIEKGPADGVISMEEKFPQFDSNLCCFYSRLLDKYILFCRANIYKGSRSIQITTSDDLITWTNFKLLQIENYDAKKRNNLYMSKFVELYDEKLFIGLTVFTNKDTGNPTEKYIKILASKDSINWYDCGKFIDCEMYKDGQHATTHVGDIIVDEDEIIVYIHNNYLQPNQTIVSYRFNKKEFLSKILEGKDITI